MTLYEFTALSSDQQLATVWEQGQYLARRHEAHQRVGLYNFGTFFVEVFYDPAINEFVRHRAFVTEKLLLAYVPDQFLSQLMAG